MSEYIEINTEESDDDETLFVYTNLQLTDGTAETYATRSDLAVGSPLAQALWAVEGLRYLQMENGEMVVRREQEAEWHALVDDITAVLKDFFL
ncbi:MAG: NifU N-terminal domain-containing protein [Candidatus Promineifilaceae bacterium]|jgi:hypothetical protein